MVETGNVDSFGDVVFLKHQSFLDEVFVRVTVSCSMGRVYRHISASFSSCLCVCVLNGDANGSTSVFRSADVKSFAAAMIRAFRVRLSIQKP